MARIPSSQHEKTGDDEILQLAAEELSVAKTRRTRFAATLALS